MARPVPLPVEFDKRPWGVLDLGPWFPPQKKETGEVWFLGPGDEPLPLLVKFIFTADKLSVQVHPPDEYAWEHEGTPGKTEMWHVLRAAPGAAIALGLTERLSRDKLRHAALSGDIEGLLNWVPVAAGDTILTPTGTIHAVGAGVTLLEIQEQSDITYRLYDWGRGRELHIEKALDVADYGPHRGKSSTTEIAPGERRLESCPWFVADLLEVSGRYEYRPGPARPHLLIAIEGDGTLAGEPFAAGAGWLVPAGGEPFPIEARGECRLVRTWVP